MLERETGQHNEAEWQEVASILRKLPLETCQRECNSVTKEWGWKAPENKAFRISGHFITNFKESEIMYFSPPVLSAEMLKEECSKDYQKYLKENNFDEDKALKSLVKYLNYEEDISPPLEKPLKFFEGKWLILPSDKSQKPEFFIKKDIYAFYENDSKLVALDDIAPESETITGAFFTPIYSWVYWRQDYAGAVLGKCKIELVKSPEKEKKLFVAKPANKEHLCFPNRKFNVQDIKVSTRKRQDETQQKRDLKDFSKEHEDFGFFKVSEMDLLITYKLPKKIIMPDEKEKKPRNIPDENYVDDF